MRSARHSGVQLMWMLPASISRIARIAPARSEVKIPAARPKAVPLAWAMADSQSSALLDRDRRAEQLVLAERRRRVDVGDHRRGDHGAVALAAGQDARPGLRGRGDRLLDPLAPPPSR